MAMTAIRNEYVTAYLVPDTSDVRVQSKSVDITIFNAKEPDISSTLVSRYNMIPADAEYVARKVAMQGGFKFHSNQRFVYGSLEDVKRLLNDKGREIARELQEEVGNTTMYGVYCSLSSRLRRVGSLTGSPLMARAIKEDEEAKTPTGKFFVVSFNGPRNIGIEGEKL